MAEPNVLADGFLDFSGGVNSLVPTTVASERVPNGLKRNQLGWLVNGTCRGTGITPRSGWRWLTTIHDGSSIYQGGGMYNPPASLPYLMVSIGGQIYQIRVDTDNSIHNITPAADPNPANAPQAYFCQGEQFMVIQAGDNLTLPLFWDGTVMRRSAGPSQNLGNNAVAFNAPAVGSLVQVTLASPYLGAVNQTVIIGGAHYQVVSGNSLQKVVTLTNRGDYPSGKNYPAGYLVDPMHPYDNHTASAVTYVAPNWFVNLSSPHHLGIGASATFFVNGISVLCTATDATHVKMSGLTYGSPQSTQLLGSPIGSPVIMEHLPVSTAGSLKTGFSSPGVGSTVQTIWNEDYTGALNVPVVISFQSFVVSGLYEITAVGYPPLPPNDILLLNLNDTPGTVHGIGSILSTAPELPAATCMDYYMGRLWYAQGRTYIAGDIVKGSSGTAPYGFKDSILRVTENQLALAGDGFSVPSNAGDIRAITHNSELDTTLGQGQLYVFCTDSIYRLNVPVSRADWIAANDATQPRQTIAQTKWGSPGDRCVVQANSDIFYQTLEPGVRSLTIATRYFQQWGNTPISRNEQRVLRFNDRSMLRFATGIQFDNRLLQSALPVQTPVGVAFQALVPLDFDLISTLEEKKPPAWEGILEGLDVLQLFVGNFGGRDRAFAVIHSRIDHSIQLYELTDSDRGDFNTTGEARTTMVIEFPAATWEQEFLIKKLTNGEMWIDRVAGIVDFTVEWRPDGEQCWTLWKVFQVCSARNSCEDVNNPVCYPIKPYGESYREVISLGLPPEGCNQTMGRPLNLGYQMQVRLTQTGWARFRGLVLYAEPVEKAYYDHMVCQVGSQTVGPSIPPPTPPPPPPSSCIDTSILNGCQGSSYTGLANVTCGNGPWTWSVGVGSLPQGLSGQVLSDSSRFLISGTPVGSGTSNFTLVARDSTGTISTVDASITILAITSSTPPDGQQGVAYSYQLTSTGGVAPFTYSLGSGTLPNGLTFNTSTGQLSGTPTQSGTFTFSLCVRASGLTSSCCLPVTLTIAASGFGMPTITNTISGAGFNWGQSCYAPTQNIVTRDNFVFFANSNDIKWIDNLTIAAGAISYGFPKNAFGMAYASSNNRVYADINNFPTIYISVINPDTQVEVTQINNGQQYDFNYVKYASSIDRILATQSDGTNLNIISINPATNLIDGAIFSTNAANEFQGGIDFRPSNNRLYIARQGSTTTTQTIRKFSFPLFTFISFVDISPWVPNDMIYISDFDVFAIAVADFTTNAPAVLFLNPNTDTFTTLHLTGTNGANMLVYDPHRQQLYIQCNLTLFVVNMSNTSTVLGTLTLDGTCNRASFNASNNKTYFPIIGGGTIDLVG